MADDSRKAVNYKYDIERFKRWHVACAYTGLSFKDWVGEALDAAAERQEAEREAAAERLRRR